MITIDHSKKGNYRKVTCECVANLAFSCENELCELTTNYLLGLQRPHYPVPAIPMQCHIYNCYVEIVVLCPMRNSKLLSWHCAVYFDEEGMS